MSVDRLERVNSLLKRVIAEAMFSVMQGDSVAPGLITVTEVKCGKDLRDATVKVSVFGDEALKEAAIRHLRHNAKRFQQVVNREVRLKFTPRLLFQLDRSLERGDEVLAILAGLDGESDTASNA
jgi:ribosome-binding factor A